MITMFGGISDATKGRALVDAWRADSARRRRETAAALDPAGAHGPLASLPTRPTPARTTPSHRCSCAVIPRWRRARRARHRPADGTHTHRLEAVRAHLLDQAGDTAAGRDAYLRAAKLTASLPEQRYLELRAAQLHNPATATTPRPPP